MLRLSHDSSGEAVSLEVTQSTILIVDDQPISRIPLDVALSQGGYLTLQAGDGQEAWEMLQEHPVSLVLADYDMPRLNGFKLCERMKADPTHRLTPVVIVTGADDVASRIAAFEHGADDILPKPVINEELVARVRNLLRFSDLVAEQLQAELSKVELERELAIARLKQEQEETRNRLYHDVLFAATGGTLQLMGEATLASLLQDWDEVREIHLDDTSMIGRARRLTESLAAGAGMDEESVGDVVLCVSEAVTNALKFGNTVLFRCGLKDGQLQLYVRDDGPGLDRSLLPQVTLHKGFSTHSSLGMGFSLMLETMDRVGLCTGPHGTAVLLSKECSLNDESEIDRFLERFSVSLD